MTIGLEVVDARLIVRNSFLPKQHQDSIGIGQANLFRKYELLNQEHQGVGLPEFYVEDQSYVVELPLLNSKHVANPHH